MYPIPNDDINQQHDPEFDHSLYEAMKKAGHVFPETEEDIDRLLENFKKSKCVAPDDFNDPMAILDNGFLSLTGNLNESRDETVDHNLAQAAREGGQIADDVAEQMRKDRKAAEDERRDSQNQ